MVLNTFDQHATKKESFYLAGKFSFLKWLTLYFHSSLFRIVVTQPAVILCPLLSLCLNAFSFIITSLRGGGRKYVHTFIIGKYKWLKSKLSAAIQKVTEVTKSKSHFYSVTSLRLVLLLWEESMATDRINCDWHSRKNPHPPVLPGLTSVERLPSDVNRGSLLVHGHLHQKNTDFSH